MTDGDSIVSAEIIGHVCLIKLKDIKKKNVLSEKLVAQLNHYLDDAERDPAIKVILLTGQTDFFCVGADIKELAGYSYDDVTKKDFVEPWQRFFHCKKVTMVAVSGYALGGGCELALMADIILASDNATFGQPEIKIGAMPGSGGTQRLLHRIGFGRTMGLCLTGDFISAQTAYEWGLVYKLFNQDDLMDQSLKIARQIASFSLPVLQAIKQSTRYAYETGHASGMAFERKKFHETFLLSDHDEGISAFLSKRAPDFKDR